MLRSKHLYKTIVLQQGESDCGVACLLSIIQYYGGTETLENLRRQSGTNIEGTTLLGLYQAAIQAGFTADGCEADMRSLLEHGKPCILHVVMNGNLRHYIVCYGTIEQNRQQKFIIGDPAKGILYLTMDELRQIWTSHTCLTLFPTENFKKRSAIAASKRVWIKDLLKKDYPLLIMAASLGIVIAVLGLAMAIFSQRLIDEILPSKNLVKLNVGIVLLFLLLLIKEGLSAMRQHFLFRQSKDFNTRIADFFYHHLLQLPKPFFDTRKIGELTARLNDTTRIQKVISQLTGNAVIDALVAMISTVFIFMYSWQVGMGCVLAMPVFYWFIYLYNKKINDGQRNIMSSYAMAEANYVSTLRGIESIKSHNKQALFTSSNKAIYQRYQRETYSLGKIQIRLSFLANAFGVFFLTGIVLYTGYSVIYGRLKTGELIAILNMCASLLPSVASLALVSIPISEAKVAFDRMFEFTGILPEKNATPGHETMVFETLQINNITFRFAGRSPLLKGISLQVSKREIVALMGENGSGKSTLSELVQKNYELESGSMIVNGNLELSEIPLADWRNIVGVVPQNVHIFNATVLENIAFEDAAAKTEHVLLFLQEYGFMLFVESLPQSFMTLVGEEGINLSGGQKQLIAIARALYKKPQVLVLDEATAAMDRESEQFVLRLLVRLKAQMGILFITHRLHVLKSFCDRIYILDKGNVSHMGNHETLIQTNNLYSSYWADFIK